MAGAYFHVPFCLKKCDYCDFYSITALSRKDAFVESLIIEIKSRAEEFRRLGVVESVYFGGGTPSILEAKDFEKILNAVFSVASVASDLEATFEANPETIDERKARDLKSLGFNCASLGVQSFDDKELKFLGRIHDSKRAVEAFEDLRKAGFETLGVDIIYALPSQTERKAAYSLRKLEELNPERVSAYGLIFEKGVPLYEKAKRGEIVPLSEEEEFKIALLTARFLKERGWERYEVSNYAKPGKRSRHNSNYWKGGEYLGLGPSAHSFLNGERYWNVRNLAKYTRALEKGESPKAGSEKLTPTQKAEEAVMLGLRSDGLDVGAFREKFGVDLKKRCGGYVETLIENGLAFWKGDKIVLTDEGYYLSDKIILEFAYMIEK